MIPNHRLLFCSRGRTVSHAADVEVIFSCGCTHAYCTESYIRIDEQAERGKMGCQTCLVAPLAITFVHVIKGAESNDR